MKARFLVNGQGQLLLAVLFSVLAWWHAESTERVSPGVLSLLILAGAQVGIVVSNLVSKLNRLEFLISDTGREGRQWRQHLRSIDARPEDSPDPSVIPPED